MSGTLATYTPPKMGDFKPSVCSTPSSSDLPTKVPMTTEYAEEICNQFGKEYRVFLATATEKFRQLTTQHKAVSASLASAKADREMLIAEIEAKDLAIKQKQEELKAKDKVIAATRERLVGEMKNVSSLKQIVGAEKIELESTVVREVVQKLNEVLSLLGGKPGAVSASEHKKNKNLQIDIELGRSVLGIIELLYKENKALVKMFGNPNDKFFGWIGDVFYPFPMKEFKQLGIPKDQHSGRNQVAGRPTNVKIVPLTTNGSSISVREYKTVHDIGLKVMGDFAKAMMKKSRDCLEMDGDAFLTSATNTDFIALVDSVIRGFIPPQLRGFFTNPQAKEEYVKVTRDGITALIAAIFNKATKDMELDSGVDANLKTVFTRQVFTAISGKCQTQKTKDLCQEAVARVNDELGIVLRVKGTRKLLTLAAQKATRGVVDDIRLMTALTEAYQPTGEPTPETSEDGGGGGIEETGDRRLRKRRQEVTAKGSDDPPKKRGRGPGTGGIRRGAGGRGIRGRIGSRGRKGTNVLTKKGRNSKVGYQQVDEGNEEQEGTKERKSVDRKENIKVKGKSKAVSRKGKELAEEKDLEDEDCGESDEEDGRKVEKPKRFVSLFGNDEEDEEEEGEEAEKEEEDNEEEDVTLVDEIVKLQAKPKSKRTRKGKAVVPQKVVPWEGSKIREKHIKNK